MTIRRSILQQLANGTTSASTVSSRLRMREGTSSKSYLKAHQPRQPHQSAEKKALEQELALFRVELVPSLSQQRIGLFYL
jgi:hypothetical protein